LGKLRPDGDHQAAQVLGIDDFVESVRALTPRGVWESRRVPASGAGPSPDRLLIGSEGALGVITEALVRLPLDAWMDRALELCRDHGGELPVAVGRDHRPWYDRQRPQPFADSLRAAKAAVDPAAILNPGVLVDP
jgi:FAD/FMN-containing dehydrogenase